jgi:dipeptidyl aminopeptidase/acylaminoacyl peptidase
MSKWFLRGTAWSILCLGPLSISHVLGCEEPGGKKRFTTADAIGMMRLADKTYFNGVSPEGRVATFSPNGMRFVVVLRKANLGRNTNEFSMYRFEVSHLFRSKHPKPLLSMSSSSNREAIHDVKWLSDNETLAFIGENPNEPAQVYSFNIRTGRLSDLTQHATAVTNYDIGSDGHVVVFSAELPHNHCRNGDVAQEQELVVTGRSLPELLQGKCFRSPERHLFVKKEGGPSLPIWLKDTILDRFPISMSPDGGHALVGAFVNECPRAWEDYESNYIRGAVISNRRKTELSHQNLRRYWLLDTTNGTVEPAMDTPMAEFRSAAWSSDGKAIFLRRMYLPLTGTSSAEEVAHRRESYDVEVKVARGEWRLLAPGEWPDVKESSPKIRVELEEGINTPPKIYASFPGAAERSMILDLNPDLADLSIGRVENVEWNVDGVAVLGGLYLPPDYRAGNRYPLVIQTHGYNPFRFSMDGLNEWSSGYAARPLAAKGFLVLQAYHFKSAADHDRVGADRGLGATEEQSFKRFNALAYETAVTYLNELGMIDPARVGISGFSRTVCFVAYSLTHAKYRFAAATLTDGIDCGYFGYLSFPNESWDVDRLNGGLSPFAKEGYEQWMREAPGFHLDQVTTPVRLVALGSDSILEQWEWYVGLALQGKAVDFVEIPDAVHLLEKPSDRWIAEEGIVDWYCFWLKGEEDDNPRKASQYARWRMLRDLCGETR